jgi:hypothetical protein
MSKNPPINISSLDFANIKTSLIDYLKTQDQFTDYPFEGSALSTLIDVLAFNTLYYGFYSNMIANETYLDTAQLQQNVTALLKPLGYTVNGNNSSKLSVVGRGTGSLSAYTSQYTGVVNNQSYSFYPIEDYTLSETEDTDITLYEANSIITKDDINDQTATDKIDLTNQSYFIDDPDIDINTIQVKVNGTKWSAYNPTTPSYKSKDQIYFIDRNNEGFYLLFTKYNVDDIPGLFGQIIKSTDEVELTYIRPTGESANGCVLSSGLDVLTANRTSDGGGRPNLDIIKTYVPKLFASAERAVTKDDYFGLLLEKAIENGLAANENELNVWGGDELDPPIYGRLFYSFNNPNITPKQVKDITLFIKEKGVITITPEYVPSVPLNLDISFKYFGTVNRLVLENDIDTYYSSAEFNKTFSTLDLTNYLLTIHTGKLSGLAVTAIKINVTFNSTDSIINLATPINSLISSNFTYSTYTNAYLKSDGNIINVYNGSIIVQSNVGSINSKGIISINTGVISDSVGSVTLTVTPVDLSAPIQAKNQYILLVSPTVVKG